MIDGLSERTRALLDAARQGLAPDAAAVMRVHAKVAAGGLFAGVAAKLLVVALLATIGGAVLVARGRHDVDAPRVTVHEVAALDGSGPPTVTTARVEGPPPARVEPVLRPVVALRTTHEPPPVQARADLAREVALLDLAMRADPSGALATLQIYDAETAGQGQMAEDAAAIGIEADCKLRDDASARLAAFDARWPSSAQRTRITEVCK